MNSYLNAKLLLFKEILKNSLIISDREIKQYSLIEKISSKTIEIYTYHNEFNKIKNNYEKFIYDFQIKNLAMSIKAASLCELKDELIFNSIKKITDVDGRLELVKSYANGIKVFIDYAHTPDALLKSFICFKNQNFKIIFL